MTATDLSGSLPEELKQYRHFVNWKKEIRPGDPKPTKVPYMSKVGREKNGDPIFYKASHNKPSTWAPLQDSLRAFSIASNRFDGIGFVFAPDDPYCGIDLDNCIDEDGNLSTFAATWIERLDSYAEISPSGRGIKILIRGELPEGKGRRDNNIGIEIYDRNRYFTLTGNRWKDSPSAIQERQSVLNSLLETVFPEPESSLGKNAKLTIDMPLSDRELLEKMFGGKKNGSEIKALFDGDLSGHNNNHSDAVAALLFHLAWWTDHDHGRTRSFFEQSGLNSGKWAEGKWERLADSEIDKAFSKVTGGYRGPRSLFTTGTTRTFHANPDSEYSNGHEPAAEPLFFALTDTGNAERFVHQHAENIRHVPNIGWLTWAERRWREDHKDLRVLNLTKETVRSIYLEAAQSNDSTERKVIADFAKRSESAGHREACLRLARSEPSIRSEMEDWDRRKWLFNVQNGTLDLEGGTFSDHFRGDFITKLSPVTFDPNATCPYFDVFMLQIFDENQALIDFVLRALGSTLVSYTPDRSLFILYGLGNNGKSTLIELVAYILGDYAISCRAETLTVRKEESIPNDIAELLGRRFVYTTETQEGARLNEGKVKQMTGNDTIKGCFKYHEPFDFLPEFKLFMATNHRPVIRDTTNSIWNRVKLIPFSVTIPDDEIDKDLPLKLKQEAPGILNRFIDGCVQWREEGLNPPPEVTAATLNYRFESDRLQNFIDDCCVMTENAFVGSTMLYECYQQWCNSNGEHIISQTAFGLKLGEKEYQKGRAPGGKIIWKGIGIRENA